MSFEILTKTEEDYHSTKDLKQEKSGSRLNYDSFVAEGALVVLLVIFFIWVVLTVPTHLGAAIDFSLITIVDAIPIFVVASLLAGWIDVWVEKDEIRNFVKGKNPFVTLFILTCLGIATPGPIIAIIPILVIMVRKDIGAHNLIAYTTSQTLMGPMRIPFELHYLGLNFFIFRMVSTIFLGMFAGLCAYAFSNWINRTLNESVARNEIYA